MKILKDNFQQSFKLRNYWELKKTDAQTHTHQRTYAYVHMQPYTHIDTIIYTQTYPYTHRRAKIYFN